MSKITIYLQAGVRIVWLIDPEEQLGPIFRPGGALDMLKLDGILDRGDVLPGLCIPGADIFF